MYVHFMSIHLVTDDTKNSYALRYRKSTSRESTSRSSRVKVHAYATASIAIALIDRRSTVAVRPVSNCRANLDKRRRRLAGPVITGSRITGQKPDLTQHRPGLLAPANRLPAPETWKIALAGPPSEYQINPTHLHPLYPYVYYIHSSYHIIYKYNTYNHQLDRYLN